MNTDCQQASTDALPLAAMQVPGPNPHHDLSSRRLLKTGGRAGVWPDSAQVPGETLSFGGCPPALLAWLSSALRSPWHSARRVSKGVCHPRTTMPLTDQVCTFCGRSVPSLPVAAGTGTAEPRGRLANAVSPWGMLATPVSLEVRNPDETPYCAASSDPLLSRVLTEPRPPADMWELSPGRHADNLRALWVPARGPDADLHWVR